MIKHNYSINTLTDAQFFSEPSEYVDLKNISLVYNDGRHWKIIPMSLASIFPIIYDDYLEDNRKENITITFCPFSLCSKIHFGKYKATEYLFRGNMVIKNKDTDNYHAQINGFVISDNKTTDAHNHINEIKIMTIRQAISRFPDCLFLVDPKRDNKESALPHSYYFNDEVFNFPYYNRFHPKTFVLGIEYHSSNIDNSVKYTAIIDSASFATKVNKMSECLNKYNNYIILNLDKIREKNGIITPILWYTWSNMYPKTKVVLI